MTGPYIPDVFADDQAGGTPITAAKLNRLENAVGGLSGRLITAGTGLTGGGDLSADRTLTVTYGTTGGTAAAGNDSRLSDARAWTLYGGGTPSTGQIPSWNGSAYVPTTVSGASPPDATATVKGLVQLAGDLAGTATAPTVPGLASRQPLLIPTVTKTAAYTAAANDYVLADVTTAWTLTLPTAPADKTRIGAKITVQPGTNALTIATGGSDHLNTATGLTTAPMSLLNQAVIFQYAAATSTWIGQASDLPLSQLDLRYDAAGAAAARVGSVTAANATVTIAGTTTAPTVAVGTIAESQVTNLTTDLTAKAPTASPTFTGTVTTARVVSTPVTVTYAATTTIDVSLGNHFRITMTGNLTLATPTNPVDGQRILVELIQDATGGRTITLPSNFNVTTSITGAVTFTTTASTRSYLGLVYRTSGTKWDVLAFGTGVA